MSFEHRRTRHKQPGLYAGHCALLLFTGYQFEGAALAISDAHLLP